MITYKVGKRVDFMEIFLRAGNIKMEKENLQVLHCFGV